MNDEKKTVHRKIELPKIENMDKRISLIDSNIKLLNNKVSKVISNGAEAGARPMEPEPSATNSVSFSEENIEKLVIGNIKTFGYIVNKSRVPIKDVAITIYDDANDVIKSLFSDSDGYWEVRLPPGDYGVEYVHKNFKPINKVVNLNKGMSKFEVR